MPKNVASYQKKYTVRDLLVYHVYIYVYYYATVIRLKS